jgi:hypothetical protein
MAALWVITRTCSGCIDVDKSVGPASSFSPWMRLARHDRIWEGRGRRILLVEASAGAAVALRRTAVRVRWRSGHGRSLSTLLLFIGINGSTRGVDIIATVAMEKADQAFRLKNQHPPTQRGSWQVADCRGAKTQGPPAESMKSNRPNMAAYLRG